MRYSFTLLSSVFLALLLFSINFENSVIFLNVPLMSSFWIDWVVLIYCVMFPHPHPPHIFYPCDMAFLVGATWLWEGACGQLNLAGAITHCEGSKTQMERILTCIRRVQGDHDWSGRVWMKGRKRRKAWVSRSLSASCLWSLLFGIYNLGSLRQWGHESGKDNFSFSPILYALPTPALEPL